MKTKHKFDKSLTGFYRPVMTMYPTEHDKVSVDWCNEFLLPEFFTDNTKPCHMDYDMMEFTLGVNQ